MLTLWEVSNNLKQKSVERCRQAYACEQILCYKFLSAREMYNEIYIKTDTYVRFYMGLNTYIFRMKNSKDLLN